MEGRFVDGRFVEGRFVEGRFVEGRFVLVPKIHVEQCGKCANVYDSRNMVSSL